MVASAGAPRAGANGAGNAAGGENGQPAAAALAPLAHALGQLESLALHLAGLEQSCSPSMLEVRRLLTLASQLVFCALLDCASCGCQASRWVMKGLGDRGMAKSGPATLRQQAETSAILGMLMSAMPLHVACRTRRTASTCRSWKLRGSCWRSMRPRWRRRLWSVAVPLPSCPTCWRSRCRRCPAQQLRACSCMQLDGVSMTHMPPLCQLPCHHGLARWACCQSAVCLRSLLVSAQSRDLAMQMCCMPTRMESMQMLGIACSCEEEGDTACLQEHSKQAGLARLQQCQERLAQLDARISATARSPPPPEIGALLFRFPTTPSMPL